MSFQGRVRSWVVSTFGSTIADDPKEAGLRLLEESLELVQAAGIDKALAMKVLESVYARPAGDPTQEVGGVMVTLARLSERLKTDVEVAGANELARIGTPEIIAKCRKRQDEKFAEGTALHKFEATPFTSKAPPAPVMKPAAEAKPAEPTATAKA